MAREALATAAKNFYHAPDERIGSDWHHRHQRQNHYFLPDRFGAARRGQDSPRWSAPSNIISPARVLKAANTTPESLDLFRIFDELLRNGR